MEYRVISSLCGEYAYSRHGFHGFFYYPYCAEIGGHEMGHYLIGLVARISAGGTAVPGHISRGYDAAVRQGLAQGFKYSNGVVPELHDIGRKNLVKRVVEVR